MEHCGVTSVASALLLWPVLCFCGVGKSKREAISQNEGFSVRSLTDPLRGCKRLLADEQWRSKWGIVVLIPVLRGSTQDPLQNDTSMM